MKQITRQTPIKKKRATKKKSSGKGVDSRLPKLSKPTRGKRKHPDFGTSKLEQDFAKGFLDKLGVKYIWQFEAKEIKRFFDYYLPESRILIEIDGDYFHSRGLVREEMNPMQKKNKRVDECKNKWAALHGIPLIRIWEFDIRNNPSQVMKMLKEKLKYHSELVQKQKEKNKRHVNKLNDQLGNKKKD